MNPFFCSPQIWLMKRLRGGASWFFSRTARKQMHFPPLGQLCQSGRFLSERTRQPPRSPRHREGPALTAFPSGVVLSSGAPGLGVWPPVSGLEVLQTGSRGSAWRGVSCVSTARRPVRALVLLLPGGRPWSQGRWGPEEQVLLASAVNQLRGRARGTGWASCPHSPPPSSLESLFNQQVQRLLQGGYKALAWLSPGGGVEAWSETPASSREPGGPGPSPQHSRQHELNQATYVRRRGGWDPR